METNEGVSINEILDRFAVDYLPTLAPQTQKDYARHIVVLRREFGERNPDEMKPKDFGPFLNVKRGQIHRARALAVLSSAITQAVSVWYMCDRNVLRDVKRPKNKPRDRLILDMEFESFKAAASPRIKLAMMLALLTGQRQGDILAFKWSDIKGDALHIYQSKTGKRIAITVNKDLEEVLDACWQLPGGGGQGSAHILPTRFGRPYSSEGFRAMWQRAMRRWMRKGNENFHFHDIRALAATKCETPEIAMRLLGHTTLAMTMRVYRRGIEKVEALRVAA